MLKMYKQTLDSSLILLLETCPQVGGAWVWSELSMHDFLGQRRGKDHTLQLPS